jgi:hypothetical protein
MTKEKKNEICKNIKECVVKIYNLFFIRKTTPKYKNKIRPNNEDVDDNRVDTKILPNLEKIKELLKEALTLRKQERKKYNEDEDDLADLVKGMDSCLSGDEYNGLAKVTGCFDFLARFEKKDVAPFWGENYHEIFFKIDELFCSGELIRRYDDKIKFEDEDENEIEIQTENGVKNEDNNDVKEGEKKNEYNNEYNDASESVNKTKKKKKKKRKRKKVKKTMKKV